MKRRALQATFALVVTVALLAAIPVYADSGCGGLWIGSAACTFELSGTSITVEGSAYSGPGMGTAYVEVSVLAPGGIVLANCSASGAEYAYCIDTAGLPSPASLATGVNLTCVVSGNVRGAYSCW